MQGSGTNQIDYNFKDALANNMEDSGYAEADDRLALRCFTYHRVMIRPGKICGL